MFGSFVLITGLLKTQRDVFLTLTTGSGVRTSADIRSAGHNVKLNSEHTEHLFCCLS